MLSLGPWRIYKHDASGTSNHRFLLRQGREREKEREKERQGIRGNLGGEDWSFAGLEHATQRNATQQLGGLTYGKEMHGQSERRWWISQGGEEDLAPEGGKLPDRASS